MKEKYEFVFTSLYGSQNYNLDNENSDKDYKMAVVPSLDSLVLDTKQYSKIEQIENGLIEVKDIRSTFTAFKKMSIVDLEILFSKEFIINKKYKEEVDRLLAMREELVAANPFRLYQVLLGVMTSGTKGKKYKPKSMAQSIRYYDLFDRYLVKGESFKSSLDTSKSELYQLMKDVKFGEADEEETIEKVEKMIDVVKGYKDKVEKDINYETYQKLDLILIDIFKKKVANSL